jgi:hypothetical protein
MAGLAVLTYVVLKSLSTSSTSVSTGQQKSKRRNAVVAIRILSNHCSVSVPLVHMAIFAYLHSSAQSATHAQASFGAVPLGSLNPLRCMIPSWSVFSSLLCVVAALPFLILVEVVVAAVVQRRREAVVVIVCVTQLMYMTLLSHAAVMLPHDSMDFYSLTSYLNASVHQTPLPGVLLTLDTLHSDRTIEWGENRGGVLLSVAVLVIVGVGAPVAFVALHHLHRDSRQQLRFLTLKYRPERWYWEAVVAIRKGLSVGVTAALFQYDYSQLQCYILVLATYLIAHEKAAPQTSPYLLLAERLSCGSAIATSNFMLFLFGIDAAYLGTVAAAVVVVVLQVAALITVLYATYLELRDNHDEAVKAGETLELLPLNDSEGEQPDGRNGASQLESRRMMLLYKEIEELKQSLDYTRSQKHDTDREVDRWKHEIDVLKRDMDRENEELKHKIKELEQILHHHTKF